MPPTDYNPRGIGGAAVVKPTGHSLFTVSAFGGGGGVTRIGDLACTLHPRRVAVQVFPFLSLRAGCCATPGWLLEPPWLLRVAQEGRH